MIRKQAPPAWMSYLIAIWLWWASSSVSSLAIKYNTAAVQDYQQFVRALRKQLVNSGDIRHEIPVLNDKLELPVEERFVLVELTSKAQKTVTLALDVTNVKIVGYRSQNDSVFFRNNDPYDRAAMGNLFKGTIRQTLRFGNAYDLLEYVAGENRNTINLGIDPLDDAVRVLYFYPQGAHDNKTLARAFIVCNQMISDAVRFRQIEIVMSQRIQYSKKLPADPSMLSLEDNWVQLSTAVQQSNNQGAFSPIQLQRSDNTVFSVDNVKLLIGIMSLMIYQCYDINSYKDSILIRQVVPNLKDGFCRDPQPNVSLIGRNNMCVDVGGANFNDGTGIQLYRCYRPNNQSNIAQVWTLRRDGTIRANGKCLTAASANSTGSLMVIYDCTKVSAADSQWKLLDDGTIVNSASGLVLTAKSGDQECRLTLEFNNYALGQSWVQSANLEAFVGSITGLNGLCLTRNDTDVWLEPCENNKAEQKWAFYGDGSIRSNQNLNNCISTDGISSEAVKITSCVSGTSGQRWMVKNDGTLKNLHYGLVLDVPYDDPNLKKIVVYPPTGNPNQQWLPLL